MSYFCIHCNTGQHGFYVTQKITSYGTRTTYIDSEGEETDYDNYETDEEEADDYSSDEVRCNMCDNIPQWIEGDELTELTTPKIKWRTRIQGDKNDI